MPLESKTAKSKPKAVGSKPNRKPLKTDILMIEKNIAYVNRMAIFNLASFSRWSNENIRSWFKYQKYNLDTKNKTDVVSIKKVETLKTCLNHQKSKIDKFFEDPAKNVLYKNVTDLTQVGEIKNIVQEALGDRYDGVYMTNAWLKMYEMLSNLSVSNNNILHFANAELPGNFVLATEFYCKMNNIEYDYFGSSYIQDNTNNKAKVTLDDKYGIRKNNPNNWDKTTNGDMTDINVVRKLSTVHNNKYNLYTSDGGIPMGLDTFNDQEVVTMSLKMGEIITGVHVLKEGKGSIGIVKIYTFFEPRMIAMLKLLQSIFEQVYIYKPCTSRPGSSEFYIIMKDKHRLTSDMSDRLYDIGFGDNPTVSTVPSVLFDAMYSGVEHQIAHMENNLALTELILSGPEKIIYDDINDPKKIVNRDELFLKYTGSIYQAQTLLSSYIYCFNTDLLWSLQYPLTFKSTSVFNKTEIKNIKK